MFVFSLGASCSLALVLSLAAFAEPASGQTWLYVGTYSQHGSKGIYRFEFDPATGKLTERAVAAEAKNPSFLAIAPNRRFLYAVSEIGDFGGKPTGAISAYAIDNQTGNLTLLNQQSSEGAGPCHVSVDGTGKNVLAANYGSGTACVLPISADGKLGRATAVVKNVGSGPNKGRQEGPHAHSINLDSANGRAFLADLGLDKVFIYQFDPQSGTLKAYASPAGTVAPGAGPRHFAFHPDGRHAYVINELNMTITAFDYDPRSGSLTEIQTISTLPKGATGKDFSTADIHVHPSGKFLYGSNRGHHSIAIYKIDPASGKLTHVGNQGEGIKTPRNFALDPTGKFLLVANQDGDSISVFRIDQTTGELTSAGEPVAVPMPVCLQFLQAGGQ